MGTRNIRCISNFRVSAFSDLHHKNKKLSSNEWADRPPDRDKTGRRYRQNPRMSHAFYYEGSCKPSSHARGLNGSRRQTGEHTCVGRSFVIRFGNYAPSFSALHTGHEGKKCPYTGSKSHTSGTIDNGVRPLITIFAQRKRKISPK